MINHFKVMGKCVLERQGYYSTEEASRRNRIFLTPLTLLPSPREKGINRAICLHFDLDKGEYRFLLDRELTPENRDYFFAFRVGSPNDKKKFLATNNIENLIGQVVDDSLAYLEDMRSAKASKEWFARHVPAAYDRLLQRLRDRFYTKTGIKKKETYMLDEGRMAADQYEVFCRVRSDMEERRKDKSQPLPVANVYKALLVEMFREGDNRDLPTIFLIKIDGRHILEHDDPDIRQAYVNLAYYDLYRRFVSEGLIRDKYCHICGREKDVMGKMPLPMKFYGITNPLYFEDIDNRNAYKSFAVCDGCMAEVLAGMKYAEHHLNEYLFGMSCYFIPVLEEQDPLFEDKLKAVVRLLRQRGSQYRSDIDYLKALLKKSKTGRQPFSFNLLFYHSEQQAFHILKYIADIELWDLMDKMALFDEFTRRYGLDLLGEYGSSLSLVDVRYALFPSGRSHPRADFKIYGKPLLNFLDNFLSSHLFSYHDIVGSFINIYKRRFRQGQADRLSAFKMVGFLSLLHQIHLLKEDSMSEGQTYAEIVNPDYRAFFETHAAVYGPHVYRQGLFLLGTMISRIVYEQRKKGEGRKEGSTFLAKINYEGIPARRVTRLVNEVKKFAIIYKVYQEAGLWGSLTDRLQGIETSSLKPDEVVFYILTGISFQDYLGMKYGLEKKLRQLPEDQDKGEDNGRQ
jgi:CRISPR-associated protein Csh1